MISGQETLLDNAVPTSCNDNYSTCSLHSFVDANIPEIIRPSARDDPRLSILQVRNPPYIIYMLVNHTIFVPAPYIYGIMHDAQLLVSLTSRKVLHTAHPIKSI